MNNLKTDLFIHGLHQTFFFNNLFFFKSHYFIFFLNNPTFFYFNFCFIQIIN
ncbi:hypothetical protein pb186bvf_002938 [Paramecium bursaria]